MAIPHLSCLLVSSLEELLAEADLLIIGHKIVTLDQLRAIAAHDCLILDLVESKMYNISPSKKEGPCYEPIAERAAS